MNRRRLIGGLAGVGALAAVGSVVAIAKTPDEWFEEQQLANTFTEDDTLLVRLEKLNALMGTDFHLILSRSKKWTTVAPSTKELLSATGSQLEQDHEYEWKVYLTRNGRRWTGDMTPVEYLHWTAQVALGYRIAQAQR